MKAIRQIVFILGLSLGGLKSYGQAPSEKQIRTQIDDLLTSLSKSDTTMFISFFDPIGGCNDKNYFTDLFIRTKQHLDTIIKSNVSIDKIDITKEEWDKPSVAYYVSVSFKSNSKRQKGIDYRTYSINNKWLIHYKLGNFTQKVKTASN